MDFRLVNGRDVAVLRLYWWLLLPITHYLLPISKPKKIPIQRNAGMGKINYFLARQVAITCFR
ncbi:MAG TPA: hypothetical protein V6D09_06280 [Leptolyngbyaceae cyanobacterium]